MLKPRARSSSGGSVSDDGHVKTPNTPPAPKAPLTPISSDEVPLPPVSSDEAPLSLPSDKALLPPVSPDEVPLPPDTPPSSVPEQLPPSPVTPDDYKTARRQRRGQWLEKVPPPAVAEMVAKQQCETEEQQCEAEEQPREPTPPPTYFPIMAFMSDANLLLLLLSYLSYSEWLQLYSANKQIQDLFQSRTLREFVLERYLCTIGYSKWNYEWAEPLALSLKASSASPPSSSTDRICRISTTIYEAWRCQRTSMLGFPQHTCNHKQQIEMLRRPLIHQISSHWRLQHGLTPE